MLTKLLSAKVAVATLAGVLAVGGVATAASVARSDDAKGKTVSAVHKADAAERADAAGGGGQGGGPDATGAAKKGLCTAWAAGEGAENGSKEDSTAFQALATAAGGADKVAAFCATATSAAGSEAAASVELTDAAKAGLCRAWAAAEESGSDAEPAALDTLAKAAGGADNIATFCEGTSAGQPDDAPTAPAGKDDHPTPPEGDQPRGSAPDDPGKPTE